MSTTHLAQLNIDVLLHLMKFVHPVDRVNLVLSGILKGFENVNRGAFFKQRIEDCELTLGLCPESPCQLEIRSFEMYGRPPDLSRVAPVGPLMIFEQLVEEGYLKNNRKLRSGLWPFCRPRFQDICSMTKLDTLHFINSEVQLEHILLFFRSCPKLVHLRVDLIVNEKLDEHLKKELKQGFQKLRIFEFRSITDNKSWPVIQEMLTWLKDCVNLSVSRRMYDTDNTMDVFLALNSTFTENLQNLTLRDTPVELVNFILPACSNIHFLELNSRILPIDARLQMVPLMKLKELHLWSSKARELREILRNCKQVEKLKVRVTEATLQDFAELDDQNLKQVVLRWQFGPSIESILPELKRLKNLQRLTLDKLSVPSFEMLCDFIMAMKHLKYLFLVFIRHGSNRDKLIPLREKITQFVSSRRPGFEFLIC